MSILENIKGVINNFVERGTDLKTNSLSESKRIRTLNRILLISMIILLFYSVLMYLKSIYLSAIICTIAFLVYWLNYILVIQGKITVAKIMFASSLLILISIFSLLFGKGLASEYWVIVSGGFYLLIFKERSTSIKMILLTLFCFFLIEWAYLYTEPYFNIDKEFGYEMALWNIFFIFITTFIISFVLRYSTEEFQGKIVESNKLLSLKNKNLMDSINYAKKIQEAVLPSDQIKDVLDKNFFVVFEPKEVVSGDFYWVYQLPDRVLFAVVDGSGVGVSGALTSITAHTFLTQCIEESGLQQPLDIFNQFSKLITERKSKWNDFLLDEIELTICCYHWREMKFSYTSNGNAIYLIKHVNNIEDIDGMEFQDDYRYIMKKIVPKQENKRASIENAIPISGMHHFRKDDMLYLATDGMAQQLGGSNGNGFTEKRLKSLMLSLQTFNVVKQELTLKDVLYNWKGKFASTDDITVLGFKL